MEKFFETLSHCPLFHGVKPSDLHSMITCLDGRTVTIPKGSPVFTEGAPARFVGVVLSGTVQVVREDYYGNRSVLTILQAGELFAEAFSFAGLETMPVSVIAIKDSNVLLLDCKRVLTSSAHSCHFHNLLLKNLLQEMAQKNLALSQKIRYMSQKTTKEKIMAYLLDQAKQQGSSEFTIPFDRQALADYLGVERSAMSAEISKLRNAGQIDTKGAWFCLKALQYFFCL
jgi:CRP-like cAMP-binding protein